MASEIGHAKSRGEHVSATELSSRFQEFLRAHSDDPESVHVTNAQALSGGWSRVMYTVTAECRGVESKYVYRSDPDPIDIHFPTSRSEEWEVLAALDRLDTVSIPEPLWFDSDGKHFGRPAIVMAHVECESLLSVARRSEEHAFPSMASRMAELLGSLHRVRPEQLPSRLGRYPSWDTYIDSRIELWLEAERHGLAPDPFLRLVASWLDANRPGPVPLGLVHGDFHPANVIVTSDDEYMAVDWELAHVGDPREDLGWMALAAEAQPPDLVGSDPDSFYATYCKVAELPEEAIDEKALQYFLVLGSTDCYLGSLARLARLARGESRTVGSAYMAKVSPGMARIIFGALKRHEQLSRG
jgi:aminoglycoside phosphotransferase (APT) family kinase protein